MRSDIVTLVRDARKMGYYTNMITSAVGLTEKRLDALVDAGLDSMQISFQSEQRDLNDFIAGRTSWEHKMKMMRAVKERNIPLTLNVVLHRLNIDRITDVCRLCGSMDPDHVEVASMQCHGWAKTNARVLMPTPEQVATAQRAIEEYQTQSSAGVYYVLPDLIEKRAKRCQQGWGSTYVCVNPQGDVLPCLSAHTLPSLQGCIPNIRKNSLETIWNSSVFEKYAGLDWMRDERAKKHPRRLEDHGGCRCQAYALTQDETAMDPVDESAEHHSAFLAWLETMYSTPTDLKALKPRRITETPRARTR